MNDENKTISISEIFEKRYHVMVWQCASMIGNNDAEDVVMETFAIMSAKWDNFDNHTEAVLVSWLNKALKYRCLKYITKKNKLIMESAEHIEKYIDSTIGFELENKENCDFFISEIRARLYPKELEVFDCLIVRELDMDETAKELRISKNSARVRWNRTQKHIKTFIDELKKKYF